MGADRSQHVTLVYAMNAHIYPCQSKNDKLMNGVPVVDFAQENGQMTVELFSKWLKYFVWYTTASDENKLLVLIDGHSSDKSIESLHFAKENSIKVLARRHVTIMPVVRSVNEPKTRLIRIFTIKFCSSMRLILWLNDYVNKENCRIWIEENLEFIIETPLYPQKKLLFGVHYELVLAHIFSKMMPARSLRSTESAIHSIKWH